MKKTSFVRRSVAFLSALVLSASATGVLNAAAETYYGTYGGYFGLENTAVHDTGNRITVDLNANDGRKASFARNADNWCVVGGASASVTLSGLTYTLSNGGSAGGDIRSVGYKNLQQMSGIYPRMTMDGVTINDTTSGGVIKLEISGLSAGTHTLKTWHSCVDNATVGTMKVTINGQTTASGIACPTRVTDEDDAGIGYSTFSVSAGQTVTVLISPEGSGNAWLNGFEIDGGDPINGISQISPADQEAHHEREKGLSWTAGKNAASHNVYIGTSFDSVYGATTSSAEFKGNQTGTTYELDETYQSSQIYYWRVDTVDKSGNVIRGSVNSFNVARLAFPSAEGYGRYARGGQGGVVVHVTSLADDGSEGTLRWALCDEQWLTEDWKGVPRIVVFDVGGVISLTDTLCIPDNGGSVYVAGQTAPGDGITLINYDFGAMGSEDVIIRDVRVRVGDMNGSSHGGMGLSSCNHTIVDHCSISWATDEGFSSRQAQNITFQWNIIGETLNNSVHYLDSDRTQTERHSFAASIGGYTGSYHHNLLINNTGRNWSLAGALEQDGATYGGQADIRNNVVYNWKDRTTDGGVRRLNFVNNYYKAGAVSDTSLHVVSIDGNELGSNDMQMMYVSGNMMVTSSGSTILAASDDAWAVGKAVTAGKGGATVSDVKSTTPFFDSYVNTESASDAYKSVIAGAGAGGTSVTGWDYIDSRYIKEVTNGTYTYTGSKDGWKGIIDSQNDVGGYPSTSTFAHSTDGATNAANDTDRDGMPNTWEEAHGLNPNDASDGCINSLSPDGYTNVEMYLNELCGDDVEFGEPPVSGKVGAVMETAHKYTITNVGSGHQLEVADSTAANGTNVQQGTTGADGWTLEDAGNGYYRIYSEVGDGKTYLLDLDYGMVDNGTNIGIWSDTASDAQLFKFVDNGDGTYTICTKATKDESCLGVTAGSTEEGANVVQWACDGSDNQKWTLEIKVDPLNGNLIQNLIVTDLTYNKDAWNYKNWALDTEIAVGDAVFGDRTFTYTALPEEIVGGEAVLTACDHKYASGDLAVFTAGADIIVYAAFDQRVITGDAANGLPAWAADWTDSGLTATSSNDVTFLLYEKAFSEGETITLGTNGQSASCLNYTVFAVAADTEEPTEATTEETTEETTEDPGDTPDEPDTTENGNSSGEETEIVYGDVDLNGTVNIMDVITLSQASMSVGDELTQQQAANADCNTDGAVNATDTLLIMQYIVKLIDALPKV